jgi:hypothetical protein
MIMRGSPRSEKFHFARDIGAVDVALAVAVAVAESDLFVMD